LLPSHAAIGAEKNARVCDVPVPNLCLSSSTRKLRRHLAAATLCEQAGIPLEDIRAAAAARAAS
jgi:hypothetical protein